MIELLLLWYLDALKRGVGGQKWQVGIPGDGHWPMQKSDITAA